MKEQILLLGTGYGGMSFLQNILPDIPRYVEITVIDRLPFHTIKPEYYALAAGSMVDKDVITSFPEHPQIIYITDEVEEIQVMNQQVICRNGTFPYQKLIVALGCVDNYFQVPWAEEFTESIQTYQKALNTREKIKRLKPNQSVVIIGAGLTGIEFCCELRELRPDINITLLEQGPSILPTLPRKIQEYVQDYLEELEIEIFTNIRVRLIEQNKVHFQFEDQPIQFDVCIWAAGIKANPIISPLIPYSGPDRIGRLTVKENYELPYRENIFVIGDCASSAFAPSAQLANIHGKQLAHYFTSVWTGQEYRPEPIKLKGVLGYLGKKRGFGLINDTAVLGPIPRVIKSGILWLHKHHIG
ncbi:FAD-dependent oxidoreductase [Microaerobacter geothermalis]|uniref:NAD(P)/FAD-dependent oxidoreductase n=1 Tax=Microaerobacter geothermalis TaxID=674972 RepID=UPI001F30FFBC|nr:FAD-dependent oxidoreductase [Microaerobacter geothermalis]MCF6094386.1 FAD-dependent oxidoreductase [Microaerobacter geothermalis]